MYLLWFDDSPKTPAAAKIAAAIACYTDRYGVAPTIVLVNEADMTTVPGVTVEARAYVRRNNFWVGVVA